MNIENVAVLLAEPAAFGVGLGVLRVPVARVEKYQRHAVAVMAGISAVAAVTAGASPTGWVPLDALLVASLGAVVTAAGTEASSVVILVGALACAVAGSGSIAFPLALAAAGLVLSGILVKAEPLVDAAAAGFLVQAALRLSAPSGRGLTALVAALVLVPLLLSAARILVPQERRTLVRAACLAAGFAVVGGVVGGIAAASAVGPLRRGLTVATSTVDATQTVGLDTTATGLADAGRDFAAARGSLEAWWALPARAVPVVAQHWRVLHAAALTGDELARAGSQALTAPGLKDIHVSEGRVPLDQLAAILPPVADVAGRAAAARNRLTDARSAWLVPPLADKLDAQLGRVRDIARSTQLANRVLAGLPRLLGKDGPRRYFLAIQTPVEARAGGGFMGNYGEITAEDGRLTLSQLGRQLDLTNAPGQAQRVLQAPEDFLARYGRFQPAQSWTNVNLSPDFPTDAGVIANLYPQSGGAPIDGVIAMDPSGLAALLGVVGAVEVPSWPTPISATNALQVLFYDQYQRFDDARSGERIDFLGEVAEVAWRRLTSGVLPPLPQLVSAFGPAVRTKHFFFSSTKPDEQRLFEDLGAAGKMAPVTGDFMGLVTQNAGGNKIDYFLRREVDYRARLDPGSGRVDSSVKITLRNDAPASGLSPTLIGNQLVPRAPDGTNKLYLSFYTPWQLVDARLDGASIILERATELGRKVYSTAVEIPPRSTVTLELSLAGKMPKSGPYRLDVYRQPVVTPDRVTATVSLPSGWEAATGERDATETLQLESDSTISVPLRRR